MFVGFIAFVEFIGFNIVPPELSFFFCAKNCFSCLEFFCTRALGPFSKNPTFKAFSVLACLG